MARFWYRGKGGKSVERRVLHSLHRATTTIRALNSLHKLFAQLRERGRILKEEVRTLLKKGAVECVSHGPGFYRSIFVVPKVEGRFQLVIDLPHLNYS
ncbi:hypothetical protein E2C01_038489 [Portunus trituberculatus]|uniref:Uncharacterized protein n=1 Tax=Portunus trituberculatus TaxID=210409 RepID=A0A5B7FAY1_PORTR|nr:hypothetical protein [Portunus trituberculatus]